MANLLGVDASDDPPRELVNLLVVDASNESVQLAQETLVCDVGIPRVHVVPQDLAKGCELLQARFLVATAIEAVVDQCAEGQAIDDDQHGGGGTHVGTSLESVGCRYMQGVQVMRRLSVVVRIWWASSAPDIRRAGHCG